MEQNLDKNLEVLINLIGKDVFLQNNFLRGFIYDNSLIALVFKIDLYRICFDVNFSSKKLFIFDRTNKINIFSCLRVDRKAAARYFIDLANIDFEENHGLEDVIVLISEILQKINKKVGIENNRLLFLTKELRLESAINILDVGANPLSFPPYQRLLDKNICNVIGFEPQKEAFETLLKNKKDNELYFNMAVGDGQVHKLYIYKSPGFSSLYEICYNTINMLNWHRDVELTEAFDLETQRLDDIKGLPLIDLVKIDIQGGELLVFENGIKTLENVVCIIPEVNFLQLYEGSAANFADVHSFLLSQGFILHKFIFTKKAKIHSKNFSIGGVANQLIDGDAIYIRDIRKLELMSNEQLKKLALFADFILESIDLSVYCLSELITRGIIKAAVVEEYAKYQLKNRPFAQME